MTLRPSLATGLPFSVDRFELILKILDVAWLIIAEFGGVESFFCDFCNIM